MNRQTAIKYRRHVEQAAVSLSDEDALNVPEMYPHWREYMTLAVNDRIYYHDKLYRVVQAHTSQADWTPDVTPALFVEISKPGEIDDWKQPTGAHDAYNKGDKVKHGGYVWTSDIDGNIWEPGVHGWTKVD
jgi:hypothetical protein